MNGTVYLICIDDPEEAVHEAIEELWADSHHEINDTQILVAVPKVNGEVVTSQSVYNRIQEKTGENFTALVLQVGPIYGYHREDVWEWLSQAGA